jgi:Ca-activated chloride channel family protein
MKFKSVLLAGLFMPGLFCARVPVTQGTLMSIDPRGREQAECPLKHTDVKAEITGFLARVTVTQDFQNTASDKIEAVYVFPLPHMSAVDDMTMTVGARTIKGTIKKREEARAIYEAAKSSGRVAGLLDQERPNIFTQSIANIMPGEKVRIVISYVERLQYDGGTYEFMFPMVVGPRYMPGTPAGKQSHGWAYDTDAVPDASRISPIPAKPGTRAGHDISLQVTLDAGVPLDALSSATHDVIVDRAGASRATIRLREKDVLPNKDFIFKYDVAGKKIEDTILTHRSQRGSFFTMILQPPERVNTADLTPKELVFVLDTSGSMYGFPITKAKESMRYALDGLNSADTFNIITFSGDTHILFPQPVAATRANIDTAKHFLDSHEGRGGTEMMKAIRASLDPSDRQDHLRVVCFMTDGYVGNDQEIIQEVKRHPNARVFAFGIGSAVNHYLLDNMAKAGRGEVDYVGLNDDGSAAAMRFYERVRNPLLTDITVDWGGLPVSDVYPQAVPDLFSAKPVVLTGKFLNPAKGVVRIRGKLAGHTVTREIPVEFPMWQTQHDVLATLWARTKIDDLMMQGSENRDQITQLGLDYRLMTQYTSFVAVEEMTVTDGGRPRTVSVPVEMPEGVNYDRVFGNETELADRLAPAAAAPVSFATPSFLPSQRANAISMEPRASMGRVLHTEPLVKIDSALTGAEVSKLVKNGKVEVRVWVSNISPAVIEELKKLGFEFMGQPKSAKLVVGRISVDKLKALSELTVVRYVAPLA